MRRLAITVVAASMALATGCSCGDEGECDSRADCEGRLACVDHQCGACLEDADCGDGAACDPGPDGTLACYDPVIVRGMVFDLEDGSAIGGARIVALDVNGSPASEVAISASDGTYELGVPSLRGADGGPAGAQITLRADAQGYQTFPGGIRQALPIDTADATAEDGSFVVESSQTDIGLLPLPAGAGTGSIYGVVERVEGEDIGTLVVAETGGVGTTGIADLDGSYAIFNLSAATFDVRGYSRGVNYEPQTVELAAGEDREVNLVLSSAPTGTFSSSVTMANAPGDAATSVIMVVESTFDEDLLRGPVPPGLRAPEPGIPPNVEGAFTIDGVPDGRYVVLAAFENDRLVRDPDPCIAGTDIVHVEFANGALVGTAPDAFKVTGALEVFEPGAGGPEEVTAAPTLRWADDSSEEWYIVTVRDALGNLVWGETRVEGTSGTNPEVAYDGPLDPGMYYQFRVVSWRSSGQRECAISTTEDLEGVFFVPAVAN